MLTHHHWPTPCNHVTGASEEVYMSTAARVIDSISLLVIDFRREDEKQCRLSPYRGVCYNPAR